MRVELVRSWDPNNPRRWLFVPVDKKTVDQHYWNGQTWTNVRMTAGVELAKDYEIRGEYRSDTEWHVWIPTKDSRIFHWWWADRLRNEVI